MSKWEILALVVVPACAAAALIYPGISIAKMVVNGALKAHDRFFG